MKPLPENVELVRDVSAAKWVADGVRPWGKSHIEVTSIVPQGFEAYARVPHEGQPDFGEGLPIDQLTALAMVLSGFTSTPASCWMCMWSGSGFWSLGSSFGISVLESDEAEVARIEAEFRKVMSERERLLDGVPQAMVRGEDYYLFHGPVAAVTSLDFTSMGDPESPNIWWPDDRAWCVGSGIDLPTTFVGGSRACIDAVIGTLGLGASQASPDDDVNERPNAGQ